MKKELKGFVCGCVATVLVTGITFAATEFKSIDVLENDIKVVVDGKELNESNFVYNDRTYLPLRATAEAVGKPVYYDEETNTAYIGEIPAKETVVAKVNGREITNLDMQYYIYNAAAKYGTDNQIYDPFGFDWSSVSDEIKNTALNNALCDAILLSKGEEMSITATDEIKTAAESEAANYKRTFGESNAPTVFKAMAMSSSAEFTKLVTNNYVLNNIQKDISKNFNKYYTGDVNALNSYLQKDKASAKHILFISDDESTDAEKLNLAKSVLKKLKSGTSFDSMIEEYNEDPGETGLGYTFASGTMVKEFEDAVFNLKLNETSDVVKTDYGYHIIKRIPGAFELAGYLLSSADVWVDTDAISAMSVADIVTDAVSASQSLQ